MLSELASATEMVIVEDWVPSTEESSTPLTVTVFVEFQLALVKVRFAGYTDNYPVSLLEIESTTLVVG